MGFLSGVSNFISKATSFVDKAVSFLKAPMESISKPLTGVLEKVADKLPFGLGKMVKPYIGEFLNKGLNWLAGGPLAGFFNVLPKVAETAEKISDALHSVDGLLKGGIKGLPEQAKENAVEGFAWTQAQGLLG